jgi:hypothetical protein
MVKTPMAVQRGLAMALVKALGMAVARQMAPQMAAAQVLLPGWTHSSIIASAPLHA